MKALLLALTLVCVPVSLSATTIIVLRSPSQVILAGDSRATSADEGRAAVRTRGGDCKVRRSGRWWFVTGGFSGSTGVDVRALVAAAITPTQTMTEALAAVRRAYDLHLRAGLQAATFFYARSERLGTPVLAIYVAGMSDGVLTVGSFGADVEAISPLTLVTYGATCPGRMCPDGRLFVGSSITSKPAIALLRAPRPEWVERGDAAAARRLIELQADATPQQVGRPVDVLEITMGGARWVGREKGSACAVVP